MTLKSLILDLLAENLDYTHEIYTFVDKEEVEWIGQCSICMTTFCVHPEDQLNNNPCNFGFSGVWFPCQKDHFWRPEKTPHSYVARQWLTKPPVKTELYLPRPPPIAPKKPPDVMAVDDWKNTYYKSLYVSIDSYKNLMKNAGQPVYDSGIGSSTNFPPPAEKAFSTILNGFPANLSPPNISNTTTGMPWAAWALVAMPWLK